MPLIGGLKGSLLMSKFRTKFNPRGSGNRFRKSLSKVSRGKQVFINIVEEEPTPEPVDKSQLISIIEYWDTSSSEYPPENYTPESYQAVLDAYSIAVAVRDNGEATQEEVDTAHINLLNAISGLEEVPSEDECKYPLDKTDFSDIPIPVLAAEPLDSSFQKFRIKAGIPDELQVAAPDGFGVDLVTGKFILPNRGVLGDSFVYAVKVKTTGTPRTVELGIPHLFLHSPEVDMWAPVGKSRIEPSPDSEAWSVRLGLLSPVRYTLPEEFTLVIFSGEEISLDIPIFAYIPELGVCDISGIFPGAPTTSGLKFGFALSGESQYEDYEVELITDKETLVNLIGNFDIPAATGATVAGSVTEVETICGEVIDLSPIEPEGTKGLDGELVGG